MGIDPFFGSLADTVEITASPVEDAPGHTSWGLHTTGWFALASGAVRWVNTTTGATGEVTFSGAGGDQNGTYLEAETGAGHITWTLDAHHRGLPAVLLPLGTGSVDPQSLQQAQISAPVTPCSGALDVP